ncbi:hypothetical protein PR048_002383 [Dryococelus australis]|uniref:Uncharacterized protein n=1 Tax=Dryococelus australis TaxID=614101 RepID=A0ABQ9IKR7_9NEOP|nr:hypothetical protein PR048_002383 [Dryococelus australis]
MRVVEVSLEQRRNEGAGDPREIPPTNGIVRHDSHVRESCNPADEGETRREWSSAGMQRRGKREIPEVTHRPAVSSGTIPICENPGVTRPGIELGSPWWEARNLTAQPPRPLLRHSRVKIAEGRIERPKTKGSRSHAKRITRPECSPRPSPRRGGHSRLIPAPGSHPGQSPARALASRR